MSKKVYFGAEGLSRRVKRIYLGVEDTARRVRRAYVGVAGVARCCLGPGGMARKGVSTLGTAAWLGAAAHAGEHLLFGGGSQRINGSFLSQVAAYDKDLTRTAATDLAVARQELSALSLAGYALFAGGNRATSYSEAVDVYDGALTKSLHYLNTARGKMGAAAVGDYALFAGGYASGSKNLVDAFTPSLTRTSTTLSTARYGCAGASVGGYALFAGGASAEKSVEAFNASLTRSQAAALGTGRYNFCGVSHAGRAVFAGGWGDSGAVDVYDASLTHTVLTNTAIKGYTSGGTLEGYAIFHGGRDTDWGIHADTVVFDESLTAASGGDLSTARWGESCGAVGEYLLFAGGGDSSAASDTVDIYTLD